MGYKTNSSQQEARDCLEPVEVWRAFLILLIGLGLEVVKLLFESA